MIRFGVVLSVVLVAIGLLAAGVVAGSLLLVVTSIGVAALAFLLLIIVVVMSRHELFGRPDSQAGGLTAIEPTASMAAAASPSKARRTGGPDAAATLEPRAPAVPAGVAAQAKVAAQPVARRGGTEISKASKSRKGRRGGAGPSERLAPAAPAGGREAETSRHAETRGEAVTAKAGAETKSDRAQGQPVVDRPATTAPERAAARHDQEAPIQRPSGAQQAVRDAPVAGDAVAAGSSAASARKDKRGEQVTPAVQLIDAAAAKAKAGAEEVMQDAAAERSSVATSDQTPGGRLPATTSVQERDRPKEYGASKLERESARAAGARAAADQGEDAAARRSSATASAQGTAPEHASPAGPPAGKPADSAGSAEPSADAEAAQVSVVPGITRYHRSDCLLIRFLSSDDLQVMTRQAAIDSGCAPCKACKPDDETASLRAG